MPTPRRSAISGAAKVKVGDEFVEYSPEAAAKLVDVSERVEGRSEFDLAFDLVRDTTEAGVYPIALVSYHIVCLQYDDQAKADLVKSFMAYVGSAGGPGSRRHGGRVGAAVARDPGAGPSGRRPDLGRLTDVTIRRRRPLHAGRSGPTGPAVPARVTPGETRHR